MSILCLWWISVIVTRRQTIVDCISIKAYPVLYGLPCFCHFSTIDFKVTQTLWLSWLLSYGRNESMQLLMLVWKNSSTSACLTLLGHIHSKVLCNCRKFPTTLTSMLEKHMKRPPKSRQRCPRSTSYFSSHCSLHTMYVSDETFRDFRPNLWLNYKKYLMPAVPS
jgi:hypothetical protein